MLPAHLTVDIIYGPSGGGVQFSNRLYFDCTAGTPSVTSISGIAIAMSEKYLPLWTACLTGGWEVFGIRARFIGSGIDVEHTVSPVDGEGTVTSTEPLPETDAVVVRRKTGLQGRDKRGRIFITGVPETFQSEGRLSAAGDSAYAALAEGIDDTVTTPTGIEFEPRCVSFLTETLFPVTHSEIVLDLLSRKDRRHPKKPTWRTVIGA